jgi:hypothetical protein
VLARADRRGLIAGSAAEARDAMNSILVIHPYKSEGTWVFDDPRFGLVLEPFVAGADTIIDRMVEGIPDAARGVTILFSAAPFPGSQYEFAWRREEFGGIWYFSPRLGMEGWLCPALFKYFESAPERIFAQVKPKTVELPAAPDWAGE